MAPWVGLVILLLVYLRKSCFIDESPVLPSEDPITIEVSYLVLFILYLSVDS
jgi:hypothetical protein